VNIFYLHWDPETCAKAHCDKHVVKMILEYAQLLSTAHHEVDGIPSIDCYKATHKNHPSAVWARTNRCNYRWLWQLLKATCKEYTHRYGKVHATERKGIVDNLRYCPYMLPLGKGMTTIPQCMPDDYKLDYSTIQAYRDYYQGEKAYMAKWTKRPSPVWWKSESMDDEKLHTEQVHETHGAT